MTVSELIDKLQKLPPDVAVRYVWDGADRSSADSVYLANGGFVVIIDEEGYAYDEEDKPVMQPENEPYLAEDVRAALNDIA